MKKKFYTCRNDIAFKEVFMSEGNEDILRGLLESILHIKITKLTYLNLEKNNGNVYFRRKHFDFHVKTETENIHIEVNGELKEYTRIRNFAFICNTYSNSVLSGEEYDDITKYIQINFNYGLSKNEEGLRIYKIMDEKQNCFVNNLFIYEFNMAYYLHLWYSKNEKGIHDYKYLIMMDLKPKELEVLSKEDKVVNRYMSEIERINIESDLYEYMSIEEDNRKIENSLKRQYRREGLEEGRKKGIKEGREEGMKEGMKEEKVRNAKKMMEENIDKEIISKITGLSLTELEKLI